MDASIIGQIASTHSRKRRGNDLTDFLCRELQKAGRAVRQKYGQAALRGGDCCGMRVATDPISSNLYSDQETGALPEAAVAASLGCGNPTALAELKPGETVLDLGSGGAGADRLRYSASREADHDRVHLHRRRAGAAHWHFRAQGGILK
jgi:hypothetical protein